MLKNASEVTLLPKNIFFLTFLKFVQSFVKCKVSLAADGKRARTGIPIGLRQLSMRRFPTVF
jgi:hypothetical protein